MNSPRISIVIIYLCLAGNILAQSDNNNDDDFDWLTYTNPERYSLDITYNQLIGDVEGIRNQWNSIGCNLNLMSKKRINAKTSIGFGVRLAFNNFRSDGVMQIVDSLEATQYTVFSENIERKKYKFTTNFLEFPIELRYRPKIGEKQLRFTLGCSFGWRLRVYENWEIEDMRYREYNFPDLKKFRFGLYARVGFKTVGFYAGYYLHPVFLNSNSSNLRIFNVGINIAIPSLI